MPDFKQVIKNDRIILYDGGMGALLQSRGMPSGISPEAFGMASRDVIRSVHEDYLNAGSQVVTTNTFGGTRYKLDGSLDVLEVNEAMALVARMAADKAPHDAWVAGSVGPTGRFLEPSGDITFDDMVSAFREQITGLVRGGVDIIQIETMMDLAETRAAVIAAREVTDLPVGVSMTFEDSASLTGTTPEIFALTMRNLGADIIGSNCSAGPEGLFETYERMEPHLSAPALIQPNAGLPELENGKTVFRLGPEDFTRQVEVFAQRGVKFMGGCCGTTPEHIAAVKAMIERGGYTARIHEPGEGVFLTSTGGSAHIGLDAPFTIIGERINPTGKETLTSELRDGVFTTATRFAHEQIEGGATVLDVNVGAPMVDETALLPQLVMHLSTRVRTPLCLDSANPDAVEAALKAYPASPLVNSISGEEGKVERLAPLCKKFGAPFILLPLKGRKLPESAGERIAIIRELVDQVTALGVPRHLIVVDVLALTVSSKPRAAVDCMETIRYCSQELRLPTVCGLSNISFGLPARELVNSTFLSMAVATGMSSCIANPGSTRLMEASAASEVLLGRDRKAERFIAGYGGWKAGSGGPGQEAGVEKKRASKSATSGEAVINGDTDRIRSLIDAELERGLSAQEIVNTILIPAITEVGEKYERKEYFLPQLILSAETMQKGFAHIKPMLEQEATGRTLGTVVLATVEGDNHDIGKNIVRLMLTNHGFDVVDLGKDVSAEAVVDAAVEHGAGVVALSALMTTTMVRMEDSVKLIRQRGLDIKVVVGGAVVTQDFADLIGADGYADDAVGAVRSIKGLLGA